MIGCADLDYNQYDEAEGKLLDGKLTSNRPEVGLVVIKKNEKTSICTGTLIRPNVVLSAAHCFDYQTFQREGYAGFLLQSGEGFKVSGIHSFGSKLGEKDLALLYLKTPVPSHLARPASILPEVPFMGDIATIYGYGCNDRETTEGEYLAQKQRYQFKLTGFPSNLCPGDSGGPVFVRGGIYWVNSGYKNASGKDIFGTATLHKNRLNHYADKMMNQSAQRYFSELSSSSRSSTRTSDEYISSDVETQDHFNSSYSDQCEGLYGDGTCDYGCTYPDPDCEDSSDFDDYESENNENFNYENWENESFDSNQGNDEGDDICEMYGYYNDNVCDHICLRPDPDCLN